MALASMTGFARSQGVSGAQRWFWELRSVNGRGLDLRLRLPQGHEALEPKLRELLQSRLARGAVQASLQVNQDTAASNVRVNMAAIETILAAARNLQEKEKLPGLSLDGLLGVRGVVELGEGDADEAGQEALRQALVAGFQEALDALCAARAAEGGRIEAVLSAQLEDMAGLIAEAVDCPERQPQAIRERLGEQVRRLLEASSQLDQDRLHQEAVLLAAKSDVQEELDRFRAHLDAARDLLGAGGAAGRKLDFLAQEFNREANTLCAKANHVALSTIGLKIKVLVDQFREQVQNIE